MFSAGFRLLCVFLFLAVQRKAPTNPSDLLTFFLRRSLPWELDCLVSRDAWSPLPLLKCFLDEVLINQRKVTIVRRHFAGFYKKNRKNGSSIDWFVVWSFDWLIDWFVVWSFDWLIDLLVCFIRSSHEAFISNEQIFQAFLISWTSNFQLGIPNWAINWLVIKNFESGLVFFQGFRFWNLKLRMNHSCTSSRLGLSKKFSAR